MTYQPVSKRQMKKSTKSKKRKQPSWKTEGYSSFAENKRMIEAGETYRSQKPSSYKRKTRHR